MNIMSQKHAFWGLSWALAIMLKCQRATVVISLSIRIEDSRKPVGNKNFCLFSKTKLLLLFPWLPNIEAC